MGKRKKRVSLIMHRDAAIMYEHAGMRNEMHNEENKKLWPFPCSNRMQLKMTKSEAIGGKKGKNASH